MLRLFIPRGAILWRGQRSVIYWHVLALVPQGASQNKMLSYNTLSYLYW